MAKKILVLSGSHKKDGNTAALVNWFAEGARSKGAKVEIVQTAFLKYKSLGCISCRACQKLKKYECVIDDEAKPVLAKMAKVDAIVMATPLYFFSASAQLKLIFDRMFSLYKWDNEADTMETPLKGKTLVLIASAYEDIGLDALEKPFVLTANYTGMKFKSLLIPNAGESGDIKNKTNIRKKAIALGKKIACAAFMSFLLFSNLSFAGEQEKLELFPKNKGTIYEYTRDNIPGICFFPADKARWDGSKVTAKEWHMLTDFQKIMFISEYIQEKKQNECKAIIKDKGWNDLIVLYKIASDLSVLFNKAATELENLHSDAPMTMPMDALFQQGKIKTPILISKKLL